MGKEVLTFGDVKLKKKNNTAIRFLFVFGGCRY